MVADKFVKEQSRQQELIIQVRHIFFGHKMFVETKCVFDSNN